jgi:predicted NBD/HSP70 family sugar kinase/transcriptional regulator with XRE-family HTH domain
MGGMAGNRGQQSAKPADWLDDAVAADPKAQAAYEDAVAREALLDQFVEARGKRSQSHVARAMGTTQSAVSDLETGGVDPRLSTLQRYARAVDTELAISVNSPQPASSPAGSDLRMALSAFASDLANERGVHEVLSAVFSAPDETRTSAASVAERTGLPKPVVENTVDQLRKEGWLDLAVHPQDGEPQFSARVQRGLVIGVSITKRSIHAVLTDLRLTVVGTYEEKLPSTSPDDVVAAVARATEALRESEAKGRDIVGLGLTLAGRVDGDMGLVHTALDLQSDDVSWDGVPLESRLEAATGLPAVVENDANATAILEFMQSGQNDPVIVVLMTDEGIGSGLVLNGAIMRGLAGMSGELGHVVVDPQGVECRCGAKGCLEVRESIAAIVDRVRAETGEAIGDGELALAAALVEDGNGIAERIFRSAGARIGRVVSDGAAIVGVPRIVILGPTQLTREHEMPSARVFLEAFRAEQRFPVYGINTDVLPRELERSTIPIAAAATAVSQFLATPVRWLSEVARARGVESGPQAISLIERDESPVRAGV